MTKRLLTARQARWANILSPYDFQITYRPGKENTYANALSRKAEDLATQKERHVQARTQTLIRPDLVIAIASYTHGQDQDYNQDLTYRYKTLDSRPTTDQSISKGQKAPPLVYVGIDNKDVPVGTKGYSVLSRP